MMKSSKTRNTPIDIARIIFALSVVILHISPFSNVNPYFNSIAAIYIPRIAVPFFLCTSGYYFINELLGGKKPLWKRLFQYLKTYSAWSLVYCFAAFLYLVPSGKRNLLQFMSERVLFFFTIGSYSHLWYMPALIFAISITAFIHKIGGRKGLLITACVGIMLFVLGCLGCSHLWLGAKLPLLSDMFVSHNFESAARVIFLCIPLFTSGYFVLALEKINNALLNVLLCISIAFFVIEVWFLVFVMHSDVRTEIFFSLYPLTIFLFKKLLKISKPGMKALSYRARAFGGFLYFSHPLIIEISKFVADKAKTTVSPLILLAVTLFACVVLWLTCYHCNKKLASILSGVSVDKATDTPDMLTSQLLL